MTVQLSPHKVGKILRCYFLGLPQIKIAKETGVDQSSISHYTARFKEMVAKYDLTATGKEYRVLNEVDSLRSLSVELYQSKLTVEEAKQGHNIIKAFLKLGINPEKHLNLIEVCKKVEDPGFTEAALKLSQIEIKTGMDYHQIISGFEEAQKQLPRLEKKISEKEAELKSVVEGISQNKKELASQGKHLEEYKDEVKSKISQMEKNLSEKMKNMGVTFKEVAEATALKAELNKEGLNNRNSNEDSEGVLIMVSKKKTIVDVNKLNEALDKFGSLQNANDQMGKTNQSLKIENIQLKQEKDILSESVKKLAVQTEEMKVKIRDFQSQYQSLSKQIMEHQYQYELFCGFMAMLAESPSVTDSVDNLINLFLALKEPGIYLPKDPNVMRSLFINVVMGDYLKCYRCDSCGAKFITNKKPKDKYFGTGYYCPTCHNWYAIKEDDSFLQAMVSEQQLENTIRLDKVLEEYEALLPFKAFLKEPCEICHEPVSEWDEYNVKLVIQQIGCGHTSCWKSDLGRMKELARAIDKYIK